MSFLEVPSTSLVHEVIKAIKADRRHQRDDINRGLGEDLAWLVLHTEREALSYATVRELYLAALVADLRHERLRMAETVRLGMAMRLRRREPEVYEPQLSTPVPTAELEQLFAEHGRRGKDRG